MRALRSLFCAVALVACLAPGARADEFTKQTFLTFSGPVQLPGITLAAGTYQFKLADPESGRRVLQVWDKDGTKLYTTLLTIPDQRMKATDKPVVMFTETVAGQPQPIRSWFYPDETYGQEFVYPKDQAMKIARETHSSVLAFDDDAKDSSAMKTAGIGRVDENGRKTDADKQVADNSTSAPSSSSSNNVARADTAQSSTAQSDAANSRPATANHPDTSSAAAVGTSGSTPTSEANRDNIPSNVAGTTGTMNRGTANSTAQATSGSNAAAPARTLPRTAGSTTTILMLAFVSLAAAGIVRIVRLRASL